MINMEVIRLNSGHALIMSHKPDKIELVKVNDFLVDHPQDIQQFGLFDRATPNYTTYYPDVTKEDLNPAESEFVEPIFRMLSSITVGYPYNPVNFPAEVLKKSMFKLIGQTVNIDHEMAVGNAIGVVSNVEWQNAYTANGVKVPAGINATLKIDGKSNPRIARGIMMNPPSIHSNSVTVSFAWEQSHKKLTREEFFEKLGTFDEGGKLVQKIAVEIKAYYETSLVSHGADPFAQKIGSDGKINNPTFAGSRYQLSEKNLFNWDWKKVDNRNIIEDIIQNAEDITNNHNNNQNLENMGDLLKALDKFFGLEEGTLTEENYMDQLEGIDFADLKAKAEAEPEPLKVLDLEGMENIENEITNLRAFKAEVPDDYKDQIAMAEFGKTSLAEIRSETERLYGLTCEDGKLDPNILSLIKSAEPKTLKALMSQYLKATENKFGFTCSACGSHDVTRASAQGADPDEFVAKSTQDVIDHYTGVSNVKLPPWMKAAMGS